METSPVKNLYCKIDFTEEEKKRVNRLVMTEFKKPVHERFWIEKIVENAKKLYKNKGKRGALKYIKPKRKRVKS